MLAVVAPLVAAMVLAPAAQAKKRYGYFQDLSVTSQSPSSIFLTILYEDDHGNGRFTPRAAVSYSLEAPVSCATGNPGDLHISGNEFNPYGYFREPLRNGLFSHEFENQYEQPQTAPLKGYVKGNVLTRQMRGSPQINGSFHVLAWDPSPGIAGCTSVGWYSATPCKQRLSPRAPNYDRWKKRKLPVCKQTW